MSGQDNPLLKNLSPHGLIYGSYKPKIGDKIAVLVPGEQLMATITNVASDTAVVAQIDGTPMTRGHTLQKGQPYCFRKKPHQIHGMVWEYEDQSALDRKIVADRFMAEEQRRIEDEARARAEEARRIEWENADPATRGPMPGSA
jgi:hypothetical protein